MEFYSLGAGVWSRVFAVPTSVVDDYIKIAGASQLKVLLWFLRNSGNKDKITANDIANGLNMNPIDVKDCMEFWINANVLSKCNEGKNTKNINTYENKVEIDTKPTGKKSKKKVKEEALSKTPTRLYNSSEIAKRIEQDEGFSNLYEEAQKILATTLSQYNMSTLMELHDKYNLPYEVITMILYYAKSENKLKMKFIEDTGHKWSELKINTVELAEKKLEDTSHLNKIWSILNSLFPVKRLPNAYELECLDKWLNEWGYSQSMILKAGEVCKNNTGEFVIGYIDRVLENWHKEGIITEKDITDSNHKNNNKKTTNKKNKEVSKNTSYNITEFEKLDMLDMMEELKRLDLDNQ